MVKKEKDKLSSQAPAFNFNVKKVHWVLESKTPQVAGTFPLNQRQMLVGRLIQCSLRWDFSGISALHAVLEITSDNRLLLYDLHSSNQTFVNKKPIVQHECRPGDEIAFGELVFVVRFKEQGIDHSPATSKRSPYPLHPQKKVFDYHFSEKKPFFTPAKEEENIEVLIVKDEELIDVEYLGPEQSRQYYAGEFLHKKNTLYHPHLTKRQKLISFAKNQCFIHPLKKHHLFILKQDAGAQKIDFTSESKILLDSADIISLNYQDISLFFRKVSPVVKTRPYPFFSTDERVPKFILPFLLLFLLLAVITQFMEVPLEEMKKKPPIIVKIYKPKPPLKKKIRPQKPRKMSTKKSADDFPTPQVKKSPPAKKMPPKKQVITPKSNPILKQIKKTSPPTKAPTPVKKITPVKKPPVKPPTKITPQVKPVPKPPRVLKKTTPSPVKKTYTTKKKTSVRLAPPTTKTPPRPVKTKSSPPKKVTPPKTYQPLSGDPALNSVFATTPTNSRGTTSSSTNTSFKTRGGSTRTSDRLEQGTSLDRGDFNRGGSGNLQGLQKGSGPVFSKGKTESIATGPEVIYLKSIDEKAVRRVLLLNQFKFQSCYQKNRLGRVQDYAQLKFRLNAQGRAFSTSVGTRIGNAKLEACMSSVLKRLQFPKPKGGNTPQFIQNLNYDPN